MNLKNKYIISGSKYFIDENIDKIVKKLNNPEINNYFGDEFNKEDFFSFIFTPSLFYDSKIAIIRNSEKIKNIDEIISNSLKSVEANILFLFNDFDLKKLKIKNINNIEIISEKKITKYTAKQEIINIFKEKGFNIKTTTAEDIFDICLQNMNIVKNELEKIEIYFYGQEKPTDDKEILNIISFSKNENIFDFIDSFAERKKEFATFRLDNIINAGESPEMLFFMLSKRIQQILIYKLSPKLVKAHPFVLNKISKSANLWNIDEINSIISEIADIDFHIKTGRTNIIQSMYLLLKNL